MIIGLGNDTVVIARIAAVLERHGARFTRRVFTETERSRSDGRKNRAASYAKRFAAKEACAKALGTGLSRGVHWRDLAVANLPSGKPVMELSGGALKILQSLLPPRHKALIHLSLTDDAPFAQAMVIIEAVPE